MMNDDFVPFLRDAKKYKIIKRIGEGNFGTVDLVEDEKGKLFAKKNIHFPENDPQAGKYFMREVIALFEFRFDGLPFVRIEGFNFPFRGTDGFITTDYIKGGSLDKLIKNKFISCKDIPTTKMIIIYGIAFALKLMHDVQIVHRDIKPENILLNDNEPILADFGFARLINKINDIFVTPKIGTLSYMAPELFDDEVKPDCSLDVYSFGVIVLEIICCELKFDKRTQNKNNKLKFINHIKKGKRFDIPGNDILPDDFKELIQSCWAHNPELRLSMNEILEKFQNNELILPGCNIDMYTQYQEKLDNIYHRAHLSENKNHEIELQNTEDFQFLPDK